MSKKKSKAKMNKQFIINREQYKKIKKMDHAAMDIFIRGIVRDLGADTVYDVSKSNVGIVDSDNNDDGLSGVDGVNDEMPYDLSKEIDKIYLGAGVFYKACIDEALDVTKGIGVKTKALFLDNFNRIECERKGDM